MGAIDTGKDAKKMGRMSPKEARSIDQDPLKVAPHKKPRKYRLTVKYVRVITETLEKDFPSKASMQNFRAGVEREIAKQKAAKARDTSRWWGVWYTGSNYKMDGVEHQIFKEGPHITESLIEGES
jgi:hypothetical protein